MKQKLAALLLTLTMVFSLAGCSADDLLYGITILTDPEIGIIGGADGPTEIIVAERDNTADHREEPSSGSNETLENESPADIGGTEEDDPLPEYQKPPVVAPAIDEDGTYNSVEEVSLYIHTYGELPDNYITKNDARDLGWEGGNVERYAGDGYAIGGDRFGNKEGLLPQADCRQYYECDIDTVDETSRGAERIVYSNDGLIYYTDDHYESFELLYSPECDEDHAHFLYHE